jgi:hypothetical protein
MKKLTLLFTLLCAANALNGMEPTSLYELQRTGPERSCYVGMEIEDLPQGVQTSIASYLRAYNNLDALIKAIKTTSMPNKLLMQIIMSEKYENQKKFTALVHMLADTFNISTAAVAQKFATPAAMLYVQLGNALLIAASHNDFDKVMELFNQHADFNYNTEQERTTPLLNAALANNQQMVQFLIKLKANPYFIHPNGMTALNVLQYQQPQEDVSMEEKDMSMDTSEDAG